MFGLASLRARVMRGWDAFGGPSSRACARVCVRALSCRSTHFTVRGHRACV